VDDEPATRDMLSQILCHAGAEVEVAESVLAVRQILSRWKPNLIISDIGMPMEDGYALMRFVRSLHPDDGGTMPAIALTAYTREQDRQAALQAGYQKYLAKPVAPGDLIKAIAELMNL
jgi:CheY-like chemotaxis protein